MAAEQDRLDALVADGLLTQEQADAISADLEERVTDLVNGELAPFPLFEPSGRARSGCRVTSEVPA